MMEENLVQAWLDRLKDLNVNVKKMFGCYCLYCDGQAVGWIHATVLSLREVGMDLPSVCRVLAKLNELGVPVGKVALSAEEAANMITEVFGEEKEGPYDGEYDKIILKDKTPFNETDTYLTLQEKFSENFDIEYDPSKAV